MEVTRQDLLSPANGISVAGFALSIYGATHIGDTSGVIEYAAGRGLDIADGFVARRTHASEFGAKLDATLDKGAVGFVLFEALVQDAAPKSVIGVVFLLNVINAGANVYIDRSGEEAATTKAGKRFMFGQNVVLAAFLLGNSLDNSALEVTGYAAAAPSLPYGLKASRDYVTQAWSVRENKRAAQAQNFKHRKR